MFRAGRESVYPTSFALFMTPEYGTKEKWTSRSCDILEDTKGSFMLCIYGLLLFQTLALYYAKLFCVLAKPPAKTKDRGA